MAKRLTQAHQKKHFLEMKHWIIHWNFFFVKLINYLVPKQNTHDDGVIIVPFPCEFATEIELLLSRPGLLS